MKAVVAHALGAIEAPRAMAQLRDRHVEAKVVSTTDRWRKGEPGGASR